MRNLVKIISILTILTISSSTVFSQSNAIIIRYIGNGGLHITDGISDIYIDFPYKSGAHNYIEYDESEIDGLHENSFYFFTHKHTDHYSEKLLKSVVKTKKGKAFGPWNISELKGLIDVISDFEIKAFKTKHRFSLKHFSLLITWHSKNIFISGDTESAKTIGQMTSLDWAFVPAWLLLDAQENNVKIDAKMIGVYHIGPKDDINITGEKIQMFKKQGEEISIPF